MTQPSNTVASFWIQDTTGHPQIVKVVQSTPTKGGISAVGNTTTVRAIVKSSGQKGQEASSSQAPAFLTNSQVIQSFDMRNPKIIAQRAPQVVAIPIGSAATNSSRISTVSPLKGEHATILPKTAQLTSSPVALSTPHRISNNQLTAHQITSTPPTPKNFISPILDHSGSRKRQEIEYDYSLESKRRKTEKVGKGLRHFSMKVCEKVQKKGITSYNEVADELVMEFTDPSRCASPTDQYEQKNIRRRVYDALNVLMAMNIISKEKKEIKWLGLPTNSLQECQNLETQKQRRMERIKVKTQQLQDLILQQIAFKNLVERNKSLEKNQGPPLPNSAIQLPFIIVNTSKKTVIDCSISNDKMEYLFNFDDTFEIHDDIEVLKRMGMALGLDKGQCTEADLMKAKCMVPKALENYVVQLASGQNESQLPVSMGPIHRVTDLDLEVSQMTKGLSRQSSMTSLSDPLRPDTATPSGGEFSDVDDDDGGDEDSDEDSDVEVN